MAESSPEWEALLLEDPGAADWADQWRRDEARRQQALDIERSLEYARANGYDIDPVTGRYLPPAGEE